jgi:hypothetical protein
VGRLRLCSFEPQDVLLRVGWLAEYDRYRIATIRAKKKVAVLEGVIDPQREIRGDTAVTVQQHKQAAVSGMRKKRRCKTQAWMG